MMALLALEGVYKDGRVELAETPEGVREARVMVVFLPEGPARREESGAVTAQERAAARLLARMRKGYHLGGDRPYENREELYDRLDRPG